MALLGENACRLPSIVQPLEGTPTIDGKSLAVWTDRTPEFVRRARLAVLLDEP